MNGLITELQALGLLLLAAAAWLGFAEHPTAASFRAAVGATFRL